MPVTTTFCRVYSNNSSSSSNNNFSTSHSSSSRILRNYWCSTVLILLLITTLAPTIQATQNLVPSSPIATRATRISSPSLGLDMTNNKENDSAVLAELKETIRKQAQEIEILRAQQQQHPTKAAASTGHGHGSVEPSEEDVARYLRQPFYQTSLTRVGWLGLFLCSLSATAVIMNTFEHTLEKHIELSYFVPLLAGHGGNTGGQTIGTILSALSSGAVQRKDATRVVCKEAMAGVLSGLVLGSIVSPIAYKVLGVSFPVATVLFFTMPLVSTIASTLGSLIPFLCLFFGLDPSVIAAPAMTSFVDVCGLMSYFLIANQIFKVFGLEL